MNEKLKHICKNYNVIVNCEFLDDDLFSKKLVEYYKRAVDNVVLDDEKMVRELSVLDGVMRKYIEDYNFSKKLKESIDVTSVVTDENDYFEALLKYIISFCSKYDAIKEEQIVSTRWI